MAYKLSFWIVLFLVFFNGGAVLMENSGADDYLGISPSTGNPDAIDSATGNVSNFDTGEGSGDSLFGLTNTVTNPLQGLFNLIFPGGEMLINAGVPAYLVTFFLSGLAIIPGYDLINFLRGI